jgi:saccharolysin
MWSEVFACDCFEKIKQHGLRDSKIGARFVYDILGCGGSVPAKEMLYNFLDREPIKEAFLREIGLTEHSS